MSMFKPATSSSKDTDGMKKAAQMNELTEQFRKDFNLSKPEAVIQVYYCTLSGVQGGQLFISQNYMCYRSLSGSETRRWAFSKVLNIELVGPKLARNVIIKISTGENQATSNTLVNFLPKHAKELVTLALYLWKNPPTIIDVKAYLEAQNSTASPPTGASPTLTKSTAKSPVPANTTTTQPGQQQQQEKPKVDTASADLLLSIALETDQMQRNIMEQAAIQSEQIKRIEANVDNINANLKKADHLMKGIESLPYYIFGGSAKNSLREKRTKNLVEKSQKAAKGAAPIFEIEIVFKKENDSLHPAVLVFEEKTFKCVDPENDSPIEKNTTWRYEDIESIVMRARHEHMDVRFKKGRLRMMAAYLQVVTNQIYLRCNAMNHKIDVTFEPGVQKFDYTDDRISKVPPKIRDAKGGTVFIRNLPKTGDLFKDQETRDAMNYVDDKLDQVYDITVGMKNNAMALNEQWQEDTEALDRIDGKVDTAIANTQNLNKRIDKQLQ